MDTKVEPQDNSKQHVSSNSSRGVHALLFILIILLITAACFGGYYLIAMTKQLASDDARFSQIENNTSSLKQAIADLQNSSQEIHDQVAEAQKIVNELQNVTSDKEEWSILEAKHLTQAANDNLQANSNVQLALGLLQTADKRISNLSNPKITSVRKALAEDIAALQGTAQIDGVGIYMQLAALNNQLDKMPLVSKHVSEATSPVELSTDKSWWKRGLHKSWAALNQIVIIRHHQAGVRPFVSPDDQAYLYQNLHALILQAMSAVLYKQPEIYNASLQQASVWVKDYFFQDSPVTKSVQENLVKLQAININPVLPSLTSSLQTFNEYFSTTTPVAATSTIN